MPLTPAEIKHRSKIANQSDEKTWVSPQHGDGRWANTPGTQRFTTEWQPMHDRILVRLEDTVHSATIIAPERIADSVTRFGTVLKCGPGKWVPGEWWKVRIDYFEPYVNDINTEFSDLAREWEWFPGYRAPLTVKPGDRVVIGRYTDWESADAGWGQNIVICQEMDVRLVLT